MRIFLAPMEGVVDHSMRNLYAKLGGIDLAVTEFVRVSESRLPDRTFHRLCPELLSPISIPVRVQLLGSHPQRLAEHAARLADLGAVGIDLNFGCPAKTVNKSRGGACLLREPELLHTIAHHVRQATPPHIPVTAKIRLGYEARMGYIENALALASGGVTELFVHGRSKEDGYKPPAYWQAIGEIRQQLAIPVIANGEIWSLNDALQCVDESGCEDLMLGRGLLAKPDLANEIKAHFSQTVSSAPFKPLAWHDVLEQAWQYHLKTLENYDLKYCGNRLKQWFMYLKRQYPEANDFFETIKRLKEPKALEHAYLKAQSHCALSL